MVGGGGGIVDGWSWDGVEVGVIGWFGRTAGAAVMIGGGGGFVSGWWGSGGGGLLNVGDFGTSVAAVVDYDTGDDADDEDDGDGDEDCEAEVVVAAEPVQPVAICFLRVTHIVVHRDLVIERQLWVQLRQFAAFG